MNVKAIIFDLHHTITRTKKSALAVFKEIAISVGINLEGITDKEIKDAFRKSDNWLSEYCIRENVEPHWGHEPSDWIEADRIIFKELGFTKIEKDIIINLEKRFKYETRETDYEMLTEDAKETLEILHKEGYAIGICTRRHDNPTSFLKRSNVLHLIDAVTWSGVKGYAKPNPFTLLQAADILKVNPKLCAFVGNYVDVDVKASIRAGMIPILVTWANPEEKDKAPEGTIVINSPRDLLPVLGLN
ncbi:MAG: HAD hydrolase-like protein [Candidatus Lokiarchaeota archaeon]|nr:HAD hydrolase-like protein [Candidatus Lokiarchaeota archaeon]